MDTSGSGKQIQNWRNLHGAEIRENHRMAASLPCHPDHMVVAYYASSPSPQFSLLRHKAITGDELPLRKGGEEVRRISL